MSPFVVALLLCGLYAAKGFTDERDNAISEIILNDAVGLYGMCAAKDGQMNLHCAVYQISVMKTMSLADRYCCVYPLNDRGFKKPTWVTCPPGDTEKNERNPMLEFLPGYFTSYWSGKMDRLETISSGDAVKEMVEKSFPGCVADSGA